MRKTAEDLRPGHVQGAADCAQICAWKWTEVIRRSPSRQERDSYVDLGFDGLRRLTWWAKRPS